MHVTCIQPCDLMYSIGNIHSVTKYISINYLFLKLCIYLFSNNYMYNAAGLSIPRKHLAHKHFSHTCFTCSSPLLLFFYKFNIILSCLHSAQIHRFVLSKLNVSHRILISWNIRDKNIQDSSFGISIFFP